MDLQGSSLSRGIKLSLLAVAFFRTSHVLVLVAKQSIGNVTTFVAMETIYLALQFGLFGILLGIIYRERPAAA